ncbi:head-tail connector protein [Aurantiacibacter luteus]|uniref:Phage gp6-like head-tail connector protein n=1 Tax=Aurantiacibacter luteus TaxID=1581420 RepID=A0A0G9MSZ6_9SPHN|nr:head-tail connector protein [Aurantiacibacter luteus]KLE32453.1 hypothetical protein AAW00_13580 [Aurantiacibacter luteus]
MSFELAPFDLPADYGDGIVSLAEMKAHLRVLSGDEDLLIGFYRDAAVDMVERYCGVRLAPCSGLEWRGEVLDAPLSLGVWPVTAISAVSWLSGDGVAVVGEAASWRVLVRDRVGLVPGQSLPAGVGGGVVVTFDAGFTDANRPPALVQAVKVFAAHLYMNREAVGGGAQSGEVPLGFRAMCSAYRMPVL